MTAKYNLYENPDPKKTGKPQPLHARIVPSGKVESAQLYELAARGSTYNASELSAAMELVTETLLTQLKEGKTVELGKLGTVSLTLKCRPVMDKKEIRSSSVEVKDLSLRTSKKIKEKLKTICLERNPPSGGSISVTPAQIDKALTAFFTDNLFITTKEYQHITGCKHTKALKELNGLIAEGRIHREGTRSCSIYLPVAGNFGK